MTPQTPWIRVDPDAPDPSAGVPKVGVVLVRAPAPATDRTGAAILGLAREWRDGGRRVFLCDACFESPFLHDTADLTNAEGLSDALLFGTSFQRIAHKLDRELHLATAGTVVPDPGAARTHPRWTTILKGFAQAEALLIVVVPETPEAGSPLDVDEAVRLDFGPGDAADEAGPHEAGPDEARPEARPEARVVSIDALAPDPPVLEPEGDVARGDVAGQLAESQSTQTETDQGPKPIEAPGDEPGGQESLSGADAVSRPVIEGVKRTRIGDSSSSTSRTLLLLLLLVILGVIAAAWYGFLEIPGITPSNADAGQPGTVAMAEGSETETSPPVAQPIVPLAPPLGWVLALGAFSDREVALQQAERLRATTSQHQVLVIPVDADGRIFHRVAAGPVEDSLEAEALRTQLERPWGLAPVDEWVVREAHLAFQLGETRDRPSALRRAEVLEELGISTHLLAIPLSDGSERFRVYAGAFASESEAAGLRSLLAEHGMANPPLVERIGRRPE